MIDYPSEEEVEQQIQLIVNYALPHPKSFTRGLRDMHQQLGLAYIFRDYVDLALIGMLFIGYLISFNHFLHLHAERFGTGIYIYLFITAPLLYGSISILSLMTKQATYEQEMVCKYNVYQVSAYRMLVFSFVSMVANSIQILITALAWQEFNPVKGIMISLTSLMLFALGFLYFTIKRQSYLNQRFLIVAWIIFNIGMALIGGIFYETLLLNVPYVVYGGVLLVTGWLYLKNLKIMFLNLGLKTE